MFRCFGGDTTGKRKEHVRSEKITFTTYPEIREWIKDKSGFERMSNWIHRKLVNEYNEENPDDPLPIWNPPEEK